MASMRSSRSALLLMTYLLIVWRKGSHCMRQSLITSSGDDCGDDCDKDFIYCVNHKNYIKLTTTSNQTHGKAPVVCQCTANYPIVVDNRFCLGHRELNQTCFLSQQCRHNNLHSNIGCFRDGHRLDETHSAVRQIVDTISTTGWEGSGGQSPELEARCQCYPHHYYDRERRTCLCDSRYIRTTGSYRCGSRGLALVSAEDVASPLHFAETIVFWIVLMLILTLLFMVLTIFRKCYFSGNAGYADYRTFVAMRSVRISRVNGMNGYPPEDRPPSYEEATHV